MQTLISESFIVYTYPSFEDIHIFTKKNNFLSKSQISGDTNIKDRKLKKPINTLKKVFFTLVKISLKIY